MNPRDAGRYLQESCLMSWESLHTGWAKQSVQICVLVGLVSGCGERIRGSWSGSGGIRLWGLRRARPCLCVQIWRCLNSVWYTLALQCTFVEWRNKCRDHVGEFWGNPGQKWERPELRYWSWRRIKSRLFRLVFSKLFQLWPYIKKYTYMFLHTPQLKLMFLLTTLTLTTWEAFCFLPTLFHSMLHYFGLIC